MLVVVVFLVLGKVLLLFSLFLMVLLLFVLVLLWRELPGLAVVMLVVGLGSVCLWCWRWWCRWCLGEGEDWWGWLS